MIPNRQLLKQLIIQNLRDQTTKYVERLIDRYVRCMETQEDTVRFFKVELMELSDNIGRL